jgi:hypothetical protein
LPSGTNTGTTLNRDLTGRVVRDATARRLENRLHHTPGALERCPDADVRLAGSLSGQQARASSAGFTYASHRFRTSTTTRMTRAAALLCA